MDIGELAHVGLPTDSDIRDVVEDIYFGRGVRPKEAPSSV
jgi:hypothetical protein